MKFTPTTYGQLNEADNEVQWKTVGLSWAHSSASLIVSTEGLVASGIVFGISLQVPTTLRIGTVVPNVCTQILTRKWAFQWKKQDLGSLWGIQKIINSR